MDGISVNVDWARRWLGCVAAVVLGVVLAGCATPVPTEAEIVGTWVGESPDGWGEPGGTVVFNADGTFSATAVPEAMLERGRESTAMSGVGTWAIYEDSVGSTFPGVRMKYPADPKAGGFSRVVFSKSGGTMILTYWNDYDLPERYVLVKQD